MCVVQKKKKKRRKKRGMIPSPTHCLAATSLNSDDKSG
jgi:hypothetical protein